MAFDLATTIDSLWAARAHGDHFPSEWIGRLSMDEAYQVQFGMLARRSLAGAKQIGWKVALTSKPTQEQFDAHEPAFGYLLEQFPSGQSFPADLIKPGCEPEICVRLGKALGDSATAAAARDAIDVCYPALEIVELRADLKRDLPLGLADNMAQKAFVLGAPFQLGAIDPARIETRVWINGKEAASGFGEAVLGSPLNSIVWLANALAKHGRGLQAGDLIMTGSFTRMLLLKPGDKVRAEFSGVGAVETAIAAA